MRGFNNYIHLLTLLLLTVLINTSGAVNYKISNLIAKNVLTFGHKMSLELVTLDPNATQNEIFSPINIFTALSQLILGAKGKSYQELEQILGLNSIQDPKEYYEELGSMLYDLQRTNLDSKGNMKRATTSWRYEYDNLDTPVSPEDQHIIEVANGLFVQNDYTINPDYRQVLESTFKTEVQPLDFRTKNKEAREYINAWVKKSTHEKIPEILKDDLDRSTKIILTSALYFKALWENPFSPSRKENFFPDGAENKAAATQVDMMHRSGIFPFYNENDCRIIGLPYKGKEMTMYIIQPHNSSRQRLRDFQNSLNTEKINMMIENMMTKSIKLTFPKMHFTRSITMKQILQTMNVSDIFRYGLSDLSLISQNTETRCQQNRRKRQVSNVFTYTASSALSNLETNRKKITSNKDDLYVDEIIHSVDFAVNEKGTEAAAATATIASRSLKYVFRCDTPFLFIIRHDPTKLPLFYGTFTHSSS